MGIQINGATDSITAIDGTIDVVSAIGNAGVVTATAFVGNITGNVTGNINHASNLELQVGGVTRGKFDSSGRLLIGTTTEGHENADDLTIATSGTGGITIRTGTSNSGSIYFSDATSGTAEYAGFVGYSHANNSMIFGTNGAEKLRIMSNGYFGFGINSPSRRIHVHTSGSGSDYMQFTNDTTGTTAGDGYVFGIDSGEDVIHNNLEATNMRFYTSGAERLRITSDGKVGINETSPLAKLHVKVADSSASAYAHTALVVEDSDHTFIDIMSGTSGSGGINFGDSGAIQRGVVEYDHNSDFMRFITAGGERLRITSGGDMGLGTGGNTVSQRLDVRESSTSVFNASSNLPTIARLYNTSSTNGASAGLQLRTDNNNGAAGIQYIHAVNSSTNYDSDLVFSRRIATSGTYAEACRITNAGNLKFPNGKGIDFSATGDSAGNQGSSELLDDYEEGSWTPAFKAGNNSTACPTSVGHAKYTRVGRLVVATAYFTMTSYASGTTGGDTRIVGLPYTNIGEHGGVAINYWWSLKQNVSFMAGTVQGNTSQILIRGTTSAAVGTANIDFDNTFGPSDSLILTATYFTS